MLKQKMMDKIISMMREFRVQHVVGNLIQKLYKSIKKYV